VDAIARGRRTVEQDERRAVSIREHLTERRGQDVDRRSRRYGRFCHRRLDRHGLRGTTARQPPSDGIDDRLAPGRDVVRPVAGHDQAVVLEEHRPWCGHRGPATNACRAAAIRARAAAQDRQGTHSTSSPKSSLAILPRGAGQAFTAVAAHDRSPRSAWNRH
jgi:hypothetical protein